jgi:hypothetical protein
MASTFTTGFGIEKIGDGEQAGAWGTTTNHNLDIIDRIASYKAVGLSGTTHTLTIREASPGSGTENLQDGMYRVIKFTGALGGNNTVTIAPNTSPAWFIIVNATTDSGSSGPYSVILTQGSGANITVLNGKSVAVYCDGAGSGAAIYDAFSDLQIGNDLSLASDSAVINFGADSDVKIIHDPDDGLFLKSTATGDDNPFLLTLQTGETDIGDNDVIGKIAFQAPDEATGTDANLVAAAVQAVAEGDFSSSSNATSLELMTASSEAASTKVYIDSAGNVGVGESSPSSYYGNAPRFVMSNTTSGEETAITVRSATDGTGYLAFADSNSGNARIAGYVQYQHSTDRLSLGIAESAEVRLTSAAFYPSSADGTSLGLATNEWSDLYLADGGVIYLGNDQDVTITHDPDDGLFLKSTATGDDNPFLLTLQTGETDIAADDVLGKIAFQAPDEAAGTDANLVAAAVQAVSEGDFSSSNNATTLQFMTGASEAATAKMYVKSDGKVGIGTASPASNFQVSSSGITDVKLETTATTSQSSVTFQSPSGDSAATHGLIGMVDADTKWAIYYQQASDHLDFRFGGGGTGDSRLKIKSDGEVRTTQDASNTFGYRCISNHSSTPIGMDVSFGGAAPDNNTQYFHRCIDTSAVRMYVMSDGDLQNADNSYGGISDERIKESITDANSQWADLKAMRVVNYKRKDDVRAYGSDAKPMIGLVAQELESVSPGLVKSVPPGPGDILSDSAFGTLYEDGDDIPDGSAIGDVKEIKEQVKSINYSVLYMKAIKALQEAMTRIETLEAKVAALEA